MSNEKFFVIFVGAFAGIGLLGLINQWIHSLHVWKLNWLNRERTMAEVTVFKWYSPFKRKTARVCSLHDRHTWYYMAPDGNPTHHDVESDLKSYVRRAFDRADEKETRQLRLEAARARKQALAEVWTPVERKRLPAARVIKP